MDYYEPPKTEHVMYINIAKEDNQSSSEDVKRSVRSAYGKVASSNISNNSCGNSRSCCGVAPEPDAAYSQELGYSQDEMSSLPEGSNMGLGCGNPSALASLKPGEVVLDLGAGGGIDVFLASDLVGPFGKVYGVDMTPEMVSQSRDYANKYGIQNVEFLLGEIEHLPLANNTIDVIISNCVVNLSTDKTKVFQESFRVLSEGGRIAISDIVALQPLPKEMVANEELYCNCISGAITVDEIEAILSKAGFSNINIELDESSRMYIKDWVPGSHSENYVTSAKITAIKPRSVG